MVLGVEVIFLRGPVEQTVINHLQNKRQQDFTVEPSRCLFYIIFLCRTIEELLDFTSLNLLHSRDLVTDTVNKPVIKVYK